MARISGLVAWLVWALLASAAPAAFQQDGRAAQSVITPKLIAKHLKTLASDRLEGRGPGTDGAHKARFYISGRLNKIGVEPGSRGSWVQKVPLRRIVNSRPDARITGEGVDWTLEHGEEFVAENRRGAGRHDVEGELVFVGHGCQAPEYAWDDYKGLDCKGKVLVMLVGDPPTEDQSLFGGKAMTYYGRWSYKFDKARDMGAAGCIVVHRAKWAGYGWPVVQNSWQGNHMNVRESDPGRQTAFEGWVTWDVAAKLVEKTGKTLDELCEEARTRDFRPVPLGLTLAGGMSNETTDIDDENIVGVIKGSDPKLANEYIIYTAHYDHLGKAVAPEGQDAIYNGAVDNASGCAAVLAIAEAFGRLERRHRRSVMFLFVGSEEQGLLGSRYYSEHPIVPAHETIANINIDGINVYETTKDLQIIGSGQSDLDGLLAAELARDGRVTAPDSESEKGYYYRSDHFNFARIGIPALYTKTGDDVEGKPPGWLKAKKDAWRINDYHRVSDEFRDDWPLTGAAADARVLFRVGYALAQRDEWPRWSETSEFKAVREKSLRAAAK